MKHRLNFYISTLALFSFFISFSQTGPAGLGTTDGSSSLQLWLRADRGISEIDGKVQSWQDQSGYGRDFSQVTASQRPLVKANALNSRSTIDFTSASDTHLNGPNTSAFFGNTGNKPTNIADFVIVFSQPTGNTADLLNFRREGTNSFYAFVSNGGDGSPRASDADDVQTFIRNGNAFNVVSSQNSSNNDGFTVGSFHIARFGFDPSDAGTNDAQWLYDIDNLLQEVNTGLDITYDGQTGAVEGSIGGLGAANSYDGEIAEIILFSTKLTDIEYVILQNYLNARYGLTTTNEFYAGDGVGDADFGVFGIGQNGAGENITTASHNGLTLTATAGLENNDYVFAGYTSATTSGNSIISNDILVSGSTLQGRMKRSWYIDKTDGGTALTADVTFNFNDSGTNVPDLSSAVLGGYKLIYRTSTGGEWTIVTAAASSINDVNKTVTFANQSLTNDGYYALATSNASTSPIGDIEQTWYSFKSGSWGSSSVWTLDGATTPTFDNSNNETPGPGDKVILTAGRTVQMYESDGTTILNNVEVQSVEVRGSAQLNLLTSIGHNLGTVSGSGTISLKGAPNTGTTAYIENLPAGNYSAFADQLLGGVIEIRTATPIAPVILNQDYSTTSVTTDPNGAVSRSLTLNTLNNADVVILQRDLYLNRNLNVTKGQLRIHRNASETYADVTFTDNDLNITVNNNVTVSTNGSVRTGTANQRHQLNLYGDLTINGTTYFTQRTTATANSDATDGIVDVNFLNQEINQTIISNAVARFYRIEIDKASSAVFLNITASAVANFNLFGRANYDINSNLGVEGTNNNAFGLVTGGVSLGNNVRIDALNTGGNYAISSLATLQVDGGRVRKTGGTALVPYGVIRLNSGLAEFLVNSGITLRDAGRIEVNGGELYANSIRTSVQASGDAGSFIQTGGSVVLNGGSGVGSSTTGSGGTSGSYYVFSLTYPENVFRMSDGTLTIKRSNYNGADAATEDNTDDLGGSIFINSSVANYSVTGGTVIVDMDDGVPAKISTTAPFYNLTLTNSGGNAIADNNGAFTLVQPDDRGIAFLSGGQVGSGAGDANMTNKPLVVLNDFIIGDGTNPIRFDHLGNNVTIGRNFTISANAEYYMGADNLLPNNRPSINLTIPASHQNTTTLNGSISSSLNFPNITNNGSDAEQLFFNLTIQKTNDAVVTVTAANKTIQGAGTNTLRTDSNGSFRLEAGTLDQGARSIRLLGSVYNSGNLGVFVPNVTGSDAFIKVREADLTIETEAGAKFGNFRMNARDGIITVDNDVTFERIQYRHGRLNIGSSNVTINELDVDLNAQANSGNCTRCFSVKDMIITNGNASDGGLTLRITSAVNPTGGSSDNLNGGAIIDALDDDDFLFPLGIGTSGIDDGTSKYTPLLLSISDVGDVGADGEAFITVNLVNSTLATTDQAFESLSYYWRVRTEGFDTQPTLDMLKVFGNDLNVPTPANLTSYISGKVLDGGTFSRTGEATNTVADPANPNFEGSDFSFTFDGNGSGSFTLENANFTGGQVAAFDGSVEIYYSRVTNNFVTNVNQADDWDNVNTWSTVSHTGSAASDYPKAGDVAIIRSFATSGERKVIIGIENYSGDAGIDVQVAKLILEKQNVNESANQFNRLMIAQNASVDFGEVDGDAAIQVFVNPTQTVNFNNTDFGAFVDRVDEGSQFMFYGTADGTSSLPAQITEYPNVRFEGNNNNNAIDRFFQFPVDAVMNRLQVDSRATLLVNRNITVNDELRIGGYRNGFVRFDGTNGAVTLDVKGNFITWNDGNGGDNDGNQIFVQNSSSNLIHQMKVGGNIQLGTATVTNFDFYTNLTTGDNVSLELATTAGENATWTNSSGITPELYQLKVNGGNSTATTFTVETDFTLPAATSSFQPLEIVNGLLVLNNAAIGAAGDIVIANGSDFYLPNTNNSSASSGSGGIQINAGQLNITGDDTGLILDGPLVLSGGDFDMSDCTGNGNNFIEYSATGEASITINNAASTLSVGSQIRRSFFSDAGILDLTITAGNLDIGVCTEGDQRRAMLEIVNDFSNLTHTGGILSFFNQNGTNASASSASLLLEPATSNLSGSTIVIDLDESNDVNFSINSYIELNDLVLQSRNTNAANTSSEVVQLKTRPLTIAGNLTLNDNIELRSNGLDLTLKGNFTLNDNAFYTPGLNETFFEVASAITTTLGGTNTSAVNFYDFDKKGAGTLNLSKDILVSGAELQITAGTIADNGNIINFTGQRLINSGTHSSTANAVNAGIRFNRTNGQQILTTGGNGIFGNIAVDNAAGVSTPDLGQEFRVNNQMTLSTGILDIGPALLVFSPNAELTNALDAGTNLSDFSETNQIQSNSSIIDFGVEKEFNNESTTAFVFPVGEDNRYTPIKVDFAAASGNSGTTTGPTPGSLRIRPRNAVAPIMLSQSQTIQDGVLQYHWLINETGMDGFRANIIANYDDDVIGTNSENTYRGARAIFSDPALAVENPFPGDASDQVDDNTNLVTYPILSENDFSGEYFAGDPNEIPDNFAALVYDNNSGDGLFSNPANFVQDTNGNGVVDGSEETRPTLIGEVSGGVVRIGDGATMSLNVDNVQFSRLVIPATGTLEINGTSGHLLGQVSGSGTIRLVTNAPNTDASLPAGDYTTFFNCDNGGALEYAGTGNYSILTGGITEVRGLTLTGVGVKTFVQTNINVCENLNLNEGTVIFSEGQTVTIGGNFNLSGSTADMSVNAIIVVEGAMNLTSGSISGGVGAEITLQGNLTRTSGTVDMTGSNAGTLNLLGTTSQTITGDFSGANSFANIVVNNTTAGNAIVVSGILGVDETLTLTDGIILTSNFDFRGAGPFTVPNVVSFNENATFAGGSSASFIDGVACKENLSANTTFRFPTGDGSTYAPVIINEDATGGATWKVRYIRTNPQTDLNSEFGNLTAQTEVSDREYWVVETSASPSQSATIGLVYGTQSNVVIPNETTIVALKDGGADGIGAGDLWTDIGRGGLSSGATSGGGEITANIASSFSANFYAIAGQTEAALPIELLSFYGEVIDGRINLQWTTASEINNDFFEVQCSIDGKSFKTIGVVSGNGNSTALINYSFEDRSPNLGLNYYRLKQFDFDGKSEIHKTILVKKELLISAIEGFIYPNPTGNENMRLRIQAMNNDAPIEVQIMSISGQLHYSQQFEGAFYIDEKIVLQRALPPGVYLLNIKQGENLTRDKLIIK
ncbi:MAG: T9SS type A sorting domain-containing protein [Cyclobacteriaceae bacterium]